ncbi:serine dehydratase subunit alpha family protein [Gorillibacterium massiliense]|uniref:L-cysteine desulfidase family protein n=1 Tax=Gorillibacterium massiliense TaxID=1280390 RepID=UPI0004B06938|nr:L-serine ammonia-lyase, iron-sulfur-dependent, subunit alpha [Gorillibacterium massiliense]
MDKTGDLYQSYLSILHDELVPAMGCTEPISIAYGAAKAREVLGELPIQSNIEVSGNIIKNVKSVTVPNTNGLKGIEASLAAGVVAGKAAAKLEVLSQVTAAEKTAIADYLSSYPIEVTLAGNEKIFYISILLHGCHSKVRLVIEDYHTNITLIEKDGEVVYQSQSNGNNPYDRNDRTLLNVQDIVEFSSIVDISAVEGIILWQIALNTTISQEGLTGDWGASIGKVLLKEYGGHITNLAKAAAAAGSDARMNGCELPVVIVSGSGNQGMTASLPVIEYAKELRSSDEELIRALVVSNLVTIHQKTGIGRLSAFCGVVSAGCGAGAGIAFLHGGDYESIAHTIVNSLAMISGMVCDGAKSSCAAKIAEAVDAGILGFKMSKNGKQFVDGDGLVSKDVDNTISNIGRMASVGMKETDKEILKIMVGGLSS